MDRIGRRFLSVVRHPPERRSDLWQRAALRLREYRPQCALRASQHRHRAGIRYSRLEAGDLALRRYQFVRCELRHRQRHRRRRVRAAIRAAPGLLLRPGAEVWAGRSGRQAAQADDSLRAVDIEDSNRSGMDLDRLLHGRTGRLWQQQVQHRYALARRPRRRADRDELLHQAPGRVGGRSGRVQLAVRHLDGGL